MKLITIMDHPGSDPDTNPISTDTSQTLSRFYPRFVTQRYANADPVEPETGECSTCSVHPGRATRVSSICHREPIRSVINSSCLLLWVETSKRTIFSSTDYCCTVFKCSLAAPGKNCYHSHVGMVRLSPGSRSLLMAPD